MATTDCMCSDGSHHTPSPTAHGACRACVAGRRQGPRHGWSSAVDQSIQYNTPAHGLTRSLALSRPLPLVSLSRPRTGSCRRGSRAAVADGGLASPRRRQGSTWASCTSNCISTTGPPSSLPALHPALDPCAVSTPPGNLLLRAGGQYNTMQCNGGFWPTCLPCVRPRMSCARRPPSSLPSSALFCPVPFAGSVAGPASTTGAGLKGGMAQSIVRPARPAAAIAAMAKGRQAYGTTDGGHAAALRTQDSSSVMSAHAAPGP